MEKYNISSVYSFKDGNIIKKYQICYNNYNFKLNNKYNDHIVSNIDIYNIFPLNNVLTEFYIYTKDESMTKKIILKPNSFNDYNFLINKIKSIINHLEIKYNIEYTLYYIEIYIKNR